MPIPLADRMGRLNAPNAQAGRAPDTASYEANIGKIGENTMNMLARSGNEMARAVTYMQRQQESMAAQDALTEYLAGRQKLDTVRDSLALENAVDFEDKYYQEAEKMHTEFVNKINRLKYADIRERARGQANETNITDAARSENFFFKQKEAVADNHTAALVEVKKRDVVNSLSSNPGMNGYNQQNIANGYIFTLDTLKNRLIEKGYRDGTPEMDMAMSKEKDKYFSDVLEELSHRPDDGLRMAHSMGKVFKQEMSPAIYNEVMKPISQHNLMMEVQKNPSKFFKNGIVSEDPKDIDFEAAAKESDALDNIERESLLTGFAKNYKASGHAEKAATDTDASREFVIREGRYMYQKLGTDLGLRPGHEQEDLKDILKQAKTDKNLRERLQKHYTDIQSRLLLWDKVLYNGLNYSVVDGQINYSGEDGYVDEGHATALLTDADKKLLAGRYEDLKKILEDPEIARAGLEATVWKGKDPTIEEVAYGVSMEALDRIGRKDRWWEFANLFNVFGKAPKEQDYLEASVGISKSIAEKRAKWGKKKFSELSKRERESFFEDLSFMLEYQMGPEFAGKFSNLKNIKSDIETNAVMRDIYGGEKDSLKTVVIDSFPLNKASRTLAAIVYYGYRKSGVLLDNAIDTFGTTARASKKGKKSELNRLIAQSGVAGYDASVNQTIGE